MLCNQLWQYTESKQCLCRVCSRISNECRLVLDEDAKSVLQSAYHCLAPSGALWCGGQSLRGRALKCSYVLNTDAMRMCGFGWLLFPYLSSENCPPAPLC
eukprot:scpid104885/ scgid21844/ 